MMIIRLELGWHKSSHLLKLLGCAEALQKFSTLELNTVSLKRGHLAAPNSMTLGRLIVVTALLNSEID